MKKFFLILIAILCMILVLTSCGKASSNVDPDAIAVIDAGRKKISVYTELYKKETGEFIIPFHKRLDEVKDQIPVITWQEGIDMKVPRGFECWGIETYDLFGKEVDSIGDLSALSVLNGGDYYFRAYVVEKHKHDATDYKGYNCVFRMNLPDLDPFVTVISNGEETVAPKYWYCSKSWHEDGKDSGWISADGPRLNEMFYEVSDRLPEVIYSEDITLKFGKNIEFREINVYDYVNYERITYTENVEDLGELPAGRYCADAVVFRNGTEVHEGETGYSGYACGFKIAIPDENGDVPSPREPYVKIKTDAEEISAREDLRNEQNPFEYRLNYLSDKLPVLTWQEGISAELSEYVELCYIEVYNSAYEKIGEYEDLSELSVLESGSYFVNILVEKNDRNVPPQYECGFILNVQ